MARYFNDWLEAYLRYTEASEAPQIFHLWTGVATIAGAMRRHVWKSEIYFDWTPNFYIVFVADPGISVKSTSINIGMRLLRQVEGIHFGPESMTWQALGTHFRDAAEYVKYYEANGEEVQMPCSCLTIQISELGTFLRTDDPSLISFLTRMWDGQRDVFQHDTVASSKIAVENPWLNVIGATTPSWIRGHFSRDLLEEGLGSRVIFVYADRKSKLVAYPSRHVKPAGQLELEKKLVHDLQIISEMSGPFEMTSKAYEWGEAWYGNLWSGQDDAIATTKFKGYKARKQAHMHKLAMVLAVSRGNGLVIDAPDLIRANEILSSVEQSMASVFQSIGMVQEARNIGEITNLVRFHGSLTSAELWNLCMHSMEQKSWYAAVRAGVEAGLLLRYRTPSGEIRVKLAEEKETSPPEAP